MAGTVYRVRGTDPADIVLEVNRVFELISDRLDKIEGFRGRPRLYDKLLTSYDVVVLDDRQGVILKDEQNPPHYWRITISGGAVTPVDLGTTYE